MNKNKTSIVQVVSRIFVQNLLWIIGFGLMVASSGLDGMYMARWMPPGWTWLGFVLNTTADASGMVLMYFYGRLQQDTSIKKRKLSSVLLAAEFVSVGYSWFFGWRQLLFIMPTIEPNDYKWVAPLAAGFIPSLLAFIGYAESLLVGKFDFKPVQQKPIADSEEFTEQAPNVNEQQVNSNKPIDLIEWRAMIPSLGNRIPKDADELNDLLVEMGYERKSVSTARRWAIEAGGQQ